MPTASTMLSRGKTGLCPFYTFNSSASIGRAVFLQAGAPQTKIRGARSERCSERGGWAAPKAQKKKLPPPFAFGKKIVHLPKL